LTWLDRVRPISAIEFRTYFVFMQVTASDLKIQQVVRARTITTSLLQR